MESKPDSALEDHNPWVCEPPATTMYRQVGSASAVAEGNEQHETKSSPKQLNRGAWHATAPPVPPVLIQPTPVTINPTSIPTLPLGLPPPGEIQSQKVMTALKRSITGMLKRISGEKDRSKPNSRRGSLDSATTDVQPEAAPARQIRSLDAGRPAKASAVHRHSLESVAEGKAVRSRQSISSIASDGPLNVAISGQWLAASDIDEPQSPLTPSCKTKHKQLDDSASPAQSLSMGQKLKKLLQRDSVEKHASRRSVEQSTARSSLETAQQDQLQGGMHNAECSKEPQGDGTAVMLARCLAPSSPQSINHAPLLGSPGQQFLSRSSMGEPVTSGLNDPSSTGGSTLNRSFLQLSMDEWTQGQVDVPEARRGTNLHTINSNPKASTSTSTSANGLLNLGSSSTIPYIQPASNMSQKHLEIPQPVAMAHASVSTDVTSQQSVATNKAERTLLMSMDEVHHEDHYSRHSVQQGQMLVLTLPDANVEAVLASEAVASAAQEQQLPIIQEESGGGGSGSTLNNRSASGEQHPTLPGSTTDTTPAAAAEVARTAEPVMPSLYPIKTPFSIEKPTNQQYEILPMDTSPKQQPKAAIPMAGSNDWMEQYSVTSNVLNKLGASYASTPHAEDTDVLQSRGSNCLWRLTGRVVSSASNLLPGQVQDNVDLGCYDATMPQTVNDIPSVFQQGIWAAYNSVTSHVLRKFAADETFESNVQSGQLFRKLSGRVDSESVLYAHFLQPAETPRGSALHVMNAHFTAPSIRGGGQLSRMPSGLESYSVTSNVLRGLGVDNNEDTGNNSSSFAGGRMQLRRLSGRVHQMSSASLYSGRDGVYSCSNAIMPAQSSTDAGAGGWDHEEQPSEQQLLYTPLLAALLLARHKTAKAAAPLPKQNHVTFQTHNSQRLSHGGNMSKDQPQFGFGTHGRTSLSAVPQAGTSIASSSTQHAVQMLLRRRSATHMAGVPRMLSTPVQPSAQKLVAVAGPHGPMSTPTATPALATTPMRGAASVSRLASMHTANDNVQPESDDDPDAEAFHSCSSNASQDLDAEDVLLSGDVADDANFIHTTYTCRDQQQLYDMPRAIGTVATPTASTAQSQHVPPPLNSSVASEYMLLLHELGVLPLQKLAGVPHSTGGETAAVQASTPPATAADAKENLSPGIAIIHTSQVYDGDSDMASGELLRLTSPPPPVTGSLFAAPTAAVAINSHWLAIPAANLNRGNAEDSDMDRSRHAIQRLSGRVLPSEMCAIANVGVVHNSSSHTPELVSGSHNVLQRLTGRVMPSEACALPANNLSTGQLCVALDSMTDGSQHELQRLSGRVLPTEACNTVRASVQRTTSHSSTYDGMNAADLDGTDALDYRRARLHCLSSAECPKMADNAAARARDVPAAAVCQADFRLAPRGASTNLDGNPWNLESTQSLTPSATPSNGNDGIPEHNRSMTPPLIMPSEPSNTVSDAPDSLLDSFHHKLCHALRHRDPVKGVLAELAALPDKLATAIRRQPSPTRSTAASASAAGRGAGSLLDLDILAAVQEDIAGLPDRLAAALAPISPVGGENVPPTRSHTGKARRASSMQLSQGSNIYDSMMSTRQTSISPPLVRLEGRVVPSGVGTPASYTARSGQHVAFHPTDLGESIFSLLVQDVELVARKLASEVGNKSRLSRSSTGDVQQAVQAEGQDGRTNQRASTGGQSRPTAVRQTSDPAAPQQPITQRRSASFCGTSVSGAASEQADDQATPSVRHWADDVLRHLLLQDLKGLPRRVMTHQNSGSKPGTLEATTSVNMPRSKSASTAANVVQDLQHGATVPRVPSARYSRLSTSRPGTSVAGSHQSISEQQPSGLMGLLLAASQDMGALAVWMDSQTTRPQSQVGEGVYGPSRLSSHGSARGFTRLSGRVLPSTATSRVGSRKPSAAEYALPMAIALAYSSHDRNMHNLSTELRVRAARRSSACCYAAASGPGPSNQASLTVPSKSQLRRASADGEHVALARQMQSAQSRRLEGPAPSGELRQRVPSAWMHNSMQDLEPFWLTSHESNIVLRRLSGRLADTQHSTLSPDLSELLAQAVDVVGNPSMHPIIPGSTVLDFNDTYGAPSLDCFLPTSSQHGINTSMPSLAMAALGAHHSTMGSMGGVCSSARHTQAAHTDTTISLDWNLALRQPASNPGQGQELK